MIEFNIKTGEVKTVDDLPALEQEPIDSDSTVEDRIAALEEELAFMTAAYTAGVNDA